MRLNLKTFLIVISSFSLTYSAARRERTYEERYGPASLSEAINFCTTIPCIPKAVQFYIRTHSNDEAVVKSDEIKSLILQKKRYILTTITKIIQENADQQRSMMYSPMLIKINDLIRSVDKLNDYSVINKTLQMALQQAASVPDTDESLFRILIENGASPQKILLWMLPNNLPSFSNVDHLIKYGLNVNEPDGLGQTALMKLATFYGPRKGDKERTLEFARFLVARGANINLADHQGYTTLMRAVLMRPYPFLDMVEWLLHLHVDILKINNDGWTAFDLAQNRSLKLNQELEYYRNSRKDVAWFIIEDTSQYRDKKITDEIINLLNEVELQQRVRAGNLKAAPAA